MADEPERGSRRDGKRSTVDFPASQEDQWKDLKDQLFGSDDGEETVPASGELALPQMPGSRKAPKSSTKPAGTKATTQKAAMKPKQKTLAQALSDTDMDRILKRQRVDNGSDEDDQNLDITKFLRDDDEDGNGDVLDEDEDTVTADEFLASLMKADGLNASFSEKAKCGETKEGGFAQPAASGLVKLEDEELNYEGEKKVKSSTRGQARSSSDGPGYVASAPVKEELHLTTKLNQEPSVVKAETDVKERSQKVDDGLFYWFDAKEQPYNLSTDPGSIFLFGKMAVQEGGKTNFVSCCVRVRNVSRCVFLLPKEGSSQGDVVKEINDICREQHIEQRRIRFVQRYYAFEDSDIPREKSTWAKLRYPGKYPSLNAKRGFQHIKKVMGASTSLMELFLIKRKMKGASFLRMSEFTPATNRVSHCRLEFTIEDPKLIRVEEDAGPTPPFTLASIQLHAQLDSRGAANEIFVASVAVYRNVNIDATIRTIPDTVLTGVRPSSADAALPLDIEKYSSEKGLPGVHRFPSEKSLLEWFSSQLGAIDPDFLIGHNFVGFTLDTLLRRYQELNVSSWSTLGRLDLRRVPRFQGSTPNVNQEKEVCVGRLVADSYLLSREYFKSIDYKLLSLSRQMKLQGLTSGGTTFEPGNGSLTPAMLQSTKELYNILLQVCNCAVLSAAVVSHLDVIRLTKRLSWVAGNLWSRTLYGARSERIEYLLLHTFHELKFITPDKYSYDMKRGRDDEEEEEGKRKAKYQGGMVLEPKSGLYNDYILLLDFNSLYPSLIQEFNICYSTVDRHGEEQVEIPPPENLMCASCAGTGSPSPCPHKCILPRVIKDLVDRRRQVKRLMATEKDPNELALLEIRQKAFKLTANSMYGCLGFEHSRFHAQPLAELVTRQGRLALQRTAERIPQVDPTLRVIYGDTDSVMIQTGIKDDIAAVRRLGYTLKKEINKQYQSLEIDIDGVFRAILLLRKKKYAALTVTDWEGEGKTYKKEVKGLDMVRRDWCKLSKDVSDNVLSRILNAAAGEDILDYVIEHMRSVADRVREGKYSLEDFVISKSLTKEPESYRGSTFPHAAVALRMKQRKELVRVGDLIRYVICAGEKLSDKAYHEDEVRKDPSLHIDAEWYLSAQIYPPVMRLCEHIQGFSNAQLSEAMGIAYHHQSDRKAEEDDPHSVDDFSHCSMFKSRELDDCFPSAFPLQVPCVHCLLKTPINPHARVQEVVAAARDSSAAFDLYVCTSCQKVLPVEYVANCFTQTCYNIIREFYSCGGGASAVRAVRTQFTYYRALFDVPFAPGCPSVVKAAHKERARRCLGTDRRVYTHKESQDEVVKEEYDPVDPLHAAADAFYKRIDSLFVNLDSLFAGM